MNRGGLLRYILKRLLIAVPVLIGITLIDYLLMNLAGNPIDMLIGPRVTAAATAAKMADGADAVEYGLLFFELSACCQDDRVESEPDLAVDGNLNAAVLPDLDSFGHLFGT